MSEAASETTGRIKIVKTPEGELPLWVREAWVGLTLPCYPFLGIPVSKPLGAVSHQEVEGSVCGVIVPQNEAIVAILNHEDIETRQAAGYLMANGFGEDGQNFFFREDEIEIVSGVTGIPMRVFSDMETGHWEEMPAGVGR